MPFDADRQADKMVTMAVDLMSHDLQNMPENASCSLMNEWRNMSADERNATWGALQNRLPSGVIQEDARSGAMMPIKADGILDPLVTATKDTHGDVFALDFGGTYENTVGVVNNANRGPLYPLAQSYFIDKNAIPVTRCETQENATGP